MSSLTAAGPAKVRGQGVKRSGFLPYLGSKLVAALVSFFVTLVIGFVIFSLMPADPVRTLTRGRPTSEAQLAQIRVQLGLDDPVWERFLTFVGDTLKGELGYSWQFQQSVSSLVADRLGPTLLLMGTAALLSIALGLWLGIRSGWRHGSLFDRIASGTSLTLWSVPTFWLGMILLVAFSVGVGPIPSLLPAGGMSDPALPQEGWTHVVDVARHLVLPCLTMVLVVFAQYVTVMRTSIIDEMGSPYLLTAKAKGLTDDAVRRRHAVPNALLPSVTMIFMHLGVLVSGAITVEAVYSWPGLGYLTYEALKIPDLPLLQGTFIVFSASVIIMNLLADVVYRFLDPRVRAQ
ncbi:ABC transporter permease [Streptosporangium roseum]|uniref:ABC transporter, permease n=1 Tax=Streptosporangium roseum (strain ATCC 12428 / DSM 43021 / JCM 3005 / KCTC 9067 / NCIMB 10171 / NRRL 2505 / NI 9100) TaxID=479432 RepID=D2BE84_STRRD|nr:ABC transporter permease [Streptosporangium roseum]ACZ90130.1 ABC transporter, permease [Streptosporangium roseum DSM 43021]